MPVMLWKNPQHQTNNSYIPPYCFPAAAAATAVSLISELQSLQLLHADA